MGIEFRKKYVLFAIILIFIICAGFVLTSTNVLSFNLNAKLNEGIKSSGLDFEDAEYIELLVKTSDNIPSKLPKEQWTSEIFTEERRGSAKQGYVITARPEGYEWGNLEKDPKSFAIIKIPISDWNASWLEPEYNYSAPKYETDYECLDKCNLEKEKDCEKRCKVANGFEILTERKYRIPLENFLTEKEITDLKNIPYNDPTYREPIIKNIENISPLIEKTDWENMPTTMKLHGSSGTFTICPSGCNYTSLVTWETAQDSDLTGTGNCIANITTAYIENVGNVAFTFDGWTTTPVDAIKVIVDKNARHDGKWNNTAFRLFANNTNGMYGNENNIIIDGVQIERNISNSYGNYSGGIYFSLANTNATIYTVSNSIVRVNTNWNQSTGIRGIMLTTPNTYVSNFTLYNNIVYNHQYAYLIDDSNYTLLANNIAFNNTHGIRVDYNSLGKIDVFNSVSFNNTDDFSSGGGTGKFYNISNCASDDGDGNLSVQPANWSNVFVDYINFDFHLKSTDTELKDVGVNLSYAFTKDIDGETRTGTWDIGADEYVSEEPADTTKPYFTTIPANASLNYLQALDVDFNASDETSFGTYAVNDTRFTINSTGGLKNNTILGVAVYIINVTINDSSNNLNSTLYQVNVSKIAPTLTYSINSQLNNISITYPQQVNASGSTTAGTIKLYRNDVDVTTENSLNQTLGVANYTYIFNVTGNQNYSDIASVTMTINVSQAGNPLTLVLNGVADNLSITYPQQTNATITGINAKLYRDDVDVTTENGLNISLSAGYYVYNVNSTGNQNYSINSSLIIYSVNVSKAILTGDLINNTALTLTYQTAFNFTISESNTGDGDVTYKIFRNNVDVTTENSSNVTLGVGTWEYILNSTGGQNYSINSSIENFTLTISQATGIINGTINGTQGNFTAYNGTANQNIYINATNKTGYGSGKIYVNGTLYNSGTMPLFNITNLSVGIYNITFEYDGNTNYSSAKEVWWVNVTQPDTIFPQISIITPTNNTNSTDISLNINYTVSDTNLQSCWYSNDSYSANTTLASCVNLTTIVWSEGYHNVTIWANDTSNNVNSSSVSFRIDTLPPYFTTFADQTIADNEALNYDIDATDDGVGVESYAINWTTNFSITASTGVLINSTSLSSGTYYINVSVNDTLGNLNSSVLKITVTSTADTTYPLFSSYYDNNASFNNSGIGLFNVTVENTNGTVWLDINGQNISATNLTNNVYNASYSFTTNGTYAYRWYAYGNGTTNLINNSGARSFTVNYSDIIKPYFTYIPDGISQSYPSNFGVDFNASDENSFGTYAVNDTRFKINASGWFNNSVILGVANYSVNVSINDSIGNSNSTIYNVNITQNTTYVLSLAITPSTSATYPTETTATGSGCPTELVCNLSLNTTGIVANPHAITLGVGVYNYTYNSTGNTNYSVMTTSSILTISQNTSAVIYTYLNNSRENITIYNNTAIWLNATLFNVTGTIYLYKNGTLINSGNSQIGNLTDFNATGLYNITSIYIGNENYSGSSETWWVNVTESIISDTTKPYFTTIPANATINYTQELDVIFTGTDETGFSSYSVNDSRFKINSTGGLKNNTILGVAVYLINITINDTSNNLNSTLYQVNVTQIASQTSLTFDKTSPQSYPNSITPTCSAITGEGTPTLTNGTSATPITLGVGNWTFNCSLTATQNYTASSNTSIFNITQNTTYVLSLTATDPITYPNSTDFAGSGCPTELSCSLNITNGIYGAGNISANYSTAGNENYSSSSIIKEITINKGIGLVNLYINSKRENYSSSNDTATHKNNIWINGTLMNGIGNINITLNGTQINYGLSPLFNITNLSIGFYNSTCLYSGNENYTYNSETWWINITGYGVAIIESVIEEQNGGWNIIQRNIKLILIIIFILIFSIITTLLIILDIMRRRKKKS